MKDTVSYVLKDVPITIWANMKKICTLERISIKEFILNSFKEKIEESENE